MTDYYTTEDKEKLTKKGFKQLFIRDVPLGSVLNRDNAESYPLIPCNTWMDKELMIQYNEDGEFKLFPIWEQSKFMNIMSSQTGTIDFLLTKVDEYYNKCS